MRARELMIGMLAGGAIGAGVALLYAPAPGEVVRRRLREGAEKTVDTVRRTATEVAENVRTRTSQMTEGAREWIERGRSLVEAQRHAVQAAAQAYREAARETRRQLEQEVSATAHPESAT